MNRWTLTILIASITGTGISNGVVASDFGVTGILDVPTARMTRDGNLAATISRQRIADIYNLTYQATPWLETTFRYTIFNARNIYSSTDRKTDRSYEVKVRLLNETGARPEIAVGIRDVLGSGIWGGEYVVASKRFGSFDATLGMGWGRFSERSAGSNPLVRIDDRFYSRTLATGGSFGGRLRGSSFFRGRNIGVLGGVSYSASKWPIRLLAEYNSDTYRRERLHQTVRDNSPWSYGIEWEPKSNYSFVVSRQQGNQWAVRMSLAVNTRSLPPRKKPRRFYSSAESGAQALVPDHINLSSDYDRLLYDVERSGLLLRSAAINRESRTATIEISNQRYAVTADAVHRALMLSEVHLPIEIDSISVILNEGNTRPATIEYRRSNPTEFKNSNALGSGISISKGREIRIPTNVTDYQIPSVALELNLAARVQLMDPEKPIRRQIYAQVSSRIKLRDGWNVWGLFGFDLDNNFSSRRPSDSRLPRVRSDINRYLTEGSTGVDALFLEHRGGINSSVYYRLYGGYLEEMYAGLGAELLFQPSRFPWGVGLTGSRVRQRDYDKGLGFRNYRTNTGFLSLYFASPFYEFDIAIHAGRYLAGDLGFTYEIRRVFSNGFSVGAFITKTNISDFEYGQGSFDKGISFRIPFNALIKTDTRNGYATVIRSLERDGGRSLQAFGSTLWWDLRSYLPTELSRHKRRMVPR